LRVKFELAVSLLRSNYALTDDQIGELLVMEPGEETSDQRWDELTRVLMGIGPKPSPAT
jgi:hypothetical protein